MKNTFGNSLTLTLFGESHGSAVGAVLDGIAPGIPVRRERMAEAIARRRPTDGIGTERREPDGFEIISGEYNGYTTGTPFTVVMENRDISSRDYEAIKNTPRPGHADYPAACKYHGFEDKRGGGHFSGRVTAALVAAGAVISGALEAKGIFIGTHLLRCAGISDRSFGVSEEAVGADIKYLSVSPFPVLSEEAGKAMKEAIAEAKKDSDSAGGILESAVVGLPTGVGEPFFDSLESVLAHGLFSIPGIKGVEFGAGFSLSDMRGSESNDPYRYENGRIVTSTNNCGGICGGLSDGMPLIFRCAVKPTSSISKPQQTVDTERSENAVIGIQGRHDPCIAPRARAVVDAITAVTLADMLVTRFGTDWLAEGSGC